MMRSGWEVYEEASVLPGFHNRRVRYQTTVMVATGRVGVRREGRIHRGARYRASTKVLTDRRSPTPRR